jgi:hypothetical protein
MAALKLDADDGSNSETTVRYLARWVSKDSW